ncbi:MAG: PLP-dependent aminotransferase family protein, partial [Kiloniellales bacterium]|nr:PLP-dependent aminotransferase family protein [Kiloniellales bacterium]
MRELLFPVQHHGKVSLQSQLRRHIVDAIIDQRLAPGEGLPSCRRMAQILGVSRNTVVLAYQALADEGLLESRERVGYFVSNDVVPDVPETRDMEELEQIPPDPVDWWGRLRLRPSRQQQIMKPRDWRRYPYSFIYGQCDPSLFPLTAWRICSRQSLSVNAVRAWMEDAFEEDDPELVEEIRSRVLPRRGVMASSEEIMVTCGAQNAIYVVAQLLTGPGTKIGFEDPGYVDARNIFQTTGAELIPIRVDKAGIMTSEGIKDCDFVYIT